MNKNYRYDERTPEEFRREIKDRTLQERSLFLLWLDMLEKKTGTRPSFSDTGCGRTGELLEDNEVSMAPDFEVEGYGALEVKFAKPLLDRTFHLKANQVKAYRDQGASILMVNGADTETPMYTMLDTNALAAIVNDCSIVRWHGFGHKPAYRIPISKFLWRPLK